MAHNETPQNLKNIQSCADVATYTLRALADALEACSANGGTCCPPAPNTTAA